MLTKEYGPSAAEILLDNHERNPWRKTVHGKDYTKDDGSDYQDLYNNRIGRDAALEVYNANRDPVEVIRELYEQGHLQTQPFNLLEKNKK